MRTARRIARFLAAVFFTLSTATAGAQAPAAVAEVDGVAITEEEVNRLIGMQLARVENQIYQLKLQSIDALVAQKLVAAEAAKRGISVAALDAEVISKTAVASEQGLARQAFIRSLRAQSAVKILLRPPVVYRAAVNVTGARILGPADAPVTIVEFSDYHCPFCKRAEETVEQLLARYGDRIRVVFKDFPIGQLHPQAAKAHEAARCAADQGKFWEYHKLLFAGSPQTTTDQLTGIAQRAGMDMSRFEPCLGQAMHRAAVQQDVDEGTKLGVAATPTFFINGRPIAGAQPLETFVRVIDDELATAPRPSAVR